jgi:hypothetical protein
VKCRSAKSVGNERSNVAIFRNVADNSNVWFFAKLY